MFDLQQFKNELMGVGPNSVQNDFNLILIFGGLYLLVLTVMTRILDHNFQKVCKDLFPDSESSSSSEDEKSNTEDEWFTKSIHQKYQIRIVARDDKWIHDVHIEVWNHSQKMYECKRIISLHGVRKHEILDCSPHLDFKSIFVVFTNNDIFQYHFYKKVRYVQIKVQQKFPIYSIEMICKNYFYINDQDVYFMKHNTLIYTSTFEFVQSHGYRNSYNFKMLFKGKHMEKLLKLCPHIENVLEYGPDLSSPPIRRYGIAESMISIQSISYADDINIPLYKGLIRLFGKRIPLYT